MKKRARNDIKLNKLIWIGALFLFVLMMVRAGQLSLSSTIDGIDLKKFASARTTQKDVIPAKRGTIYDVNGNVAVVNKFYIPVEKAVIKVFSSHFSL